MRSWEETIARLEARPEPCLGCTVTDRHGHRCYLERDHTDRPHLRITHHIQDEHDTYKGLGWAEWEDDDSLIDLPIRECPHEAHDRATCRHGECQAWRCRVVDRAASVKETSG